MDAPVTNRLERNMEMAVAALFGAALAYAAFLVLRAQTGFAMAYACAAGLAGFLASLRMLGRVESRDPGFSVATFEPRVLEFAELEELLLTEADRVGPVHAAGGELLLGDSDRFDQDELLLTDADRLRPGLEPLVLDDILAEIGPDSRVVRLFDRKAMPTPGQMKSRIDGHLQRGAGAPEYPDASQALSEALAQLRRSLR